MSELAALGISNRQLRQVGSVGKNMLPIFSNCTRLPRLAFFIDPLKLLTVHLKSWTLHTSVKNLFQPVFSSIENIIWATLNAWYLLCMYKNKNSTIRYFQDSWDPKFCFNRYDTPNYGLSCSSIWDTWRNETLTILNQKVYSVATGQCIEMVKIR